MNILFCGNLDVKNNIAAFYTLSFFKNALEENNHRVFILGSGDKKEIKIKDLSGSKSIFLYRPPNFNKYFSRTYQIIQHDKNKLKENLPNIILEKKIQLIIVYSTFYPILEEAFEIANKFDIKCISYGGEYFSINLKNLINTTNIYQYLAKRLSYKKLDGHICSTFFHQETLKKSNLKTIVIPTLAPELNLQSKKIRTNSKLFNLVWMGKPNQREYLIRIIKAFKIAQKKIPYLQLILISKIDFDDNSLDKKLKEEIKDSYNIRVTGFLAEKEKGDLLNQANAFIHLRKKSKETFHAFPTRVPEYVAYKKPIIFSNTPPFVDYFKHLKNAYFINSRNNINEIANAILNLYFNKRLCNSLGKNCEKLIMNDFSIKKNGSKLNNFIESLF